MSDRPPRSKHRRVLRWIGVVVLFIVGWFVVNRALRPWTIVRVIEEDLPAHLMPDAGAGGSADAAEAGAPLPGARVRIMAYNIAHGRGQADTNWCDHRERLARLGQIAGVLRDADADIVVLNEVDFDAVWSRHTNQAELLARQAGYS